MIVSAGELEQPLALVLGCGVGGTAMALAQAFPHVLAIDSSQRSIDAAKVGRRAVGYAPMMQ